MIILGICLWFLCGLISCVINKVQNGPYVPILVYTLLVFYGPIGLLLTILFILCDIEI